MKQQVYIVDALAQRRKAVALVLESVGGFCVASFARYSQLPADATQQIVLLHSDLPLPPSGLPRLFRYCDRPAITGSADVLVVNRHNLPAFAENFRLAVQGLSKGTS